MTSAGRSLLLVAAGVTLASCAGDGAPLPDQRIDVGSHRLQIHREGRGTPTVVIDTGIGDELDRLAGLQRRIARVTHVCTYNRAGYGASDPGPLPRDSGREAQELKTLLENASVPGPYVLVGHSLGAVNVQVYASAYPEDVVGLVLLDPPPLSFLLGGQYPDLAALAERMTAEWQALADSGTGRAAFFRTVASEHREMFGKSARLAASISTFGELPLVVMAAGKPNPAFGDVADEFQRYWIEQSRALTAKSANGEFILAEDASHHLYADVPDLVAESILSVVREVRLE